MEATLFGETKDSETKKILDILKDSGLTVYFEEIKHIDSPLMDAAKVLIKLKRSCPCYFS